MREGLPVAVELFYPAEPENSGSKTCRLQAMSN